jgi:NAD+ synthase (glutamine-hydrolysing)
MGARLRCGPELELCSYSCADHFLETDLLYHCWQSLIEILTSEHTSGILLDIGSPVLHRGVLYNCRMICLNGKLILIRPKLFLANDGNFREERWFKGWKGTNHVEDHYLPRIMQKIQGAIKVPIGIALISTPDTCFAAETCEELFVPDSPHVGMGLAGVEIFTNSSASHHQLRKLDQRLSLIIDATQKNGGVYMYANQQGHDGDRLYYDGGALIAVNGKVVAQGSQFGLKDVEVITATVDLEAIRAKRLSSSRAAQAVKAPEYMRIEVDFPLSAPTEDLSISPTPTREVFYHKVISFDRFSCLIY